jgi:hypothetical protein
MAPSVDVTAARKALAVPFFKRHNGRANLLFWISTATGANLRTRIRDPSCLKKPLARGSGCARSARPTPSPWSAWRFGLVWRGREAGHEPIDPGVSRWLAAARAGSEEALGQLLQTYRQRAGAGTERLPEDYRRVLRWRYQEHVSFEEIARRMPLASCGRGRSGG